MGDAPPHHGFDSHTTPPIARHPDFLLQDAGRAERLPWDAGYREVVRYAGRQRRVVPLSGGAT